MCILLPAVPSNSCESACVCSGRMDNVTSFWFVSAKQDIAKMFIIVWLRWKTQKYNGTKHWIKVSNEYTKTSDFCGVIRRLWSFSHYYIKQTEMADFHDVFHHLRSLMMTSCRVLLHQVVIDCSSQITQLLMFTLQWKIEMDINLDLMKFKLLLRFEMWSLHSRTYFTHTGKHLCAHI